MKLYVELRSIPHPKDPSAKTMYTFTFRYPKYVLYSYMALSVTYWVLGSLGDSFGAKL